MRGLYLLTRSVPLAPVGSYMYNVHVHVSRSNMGESLDCHPGRQFNKKLPSFNFGDFRRFISAGTVISTIMLKPASFPILDHGMTNVPEKKRSVPFWRVLGSFYPPADLDPAPPPPPLSPPFQLRPREGGGGGVRRRRVQNPRCRGKRSR